MTRGWAVCSAYDCKVVFEIKTKGQRFHTKACGRRHRYLKKRTLPFERKCEECKAKFEPYNNQKFCTPKCGNAKWSRTWRRAHKAQKAEIQRAWREAHPNYHNEALARRYRKAPT